MPVTVMINELMWEYNLTEFSAVYLLNKYIAQDRYEELCDIVKFKRSIPQYIEC